MLDLLDFILSLLDSLFEILLFIPTYILNVLEFMKVIYLEFPNVIFISLGHLPDFVVSGFSVILYFLFSLFIIKLVSLVMGMKG